jgi:protein TonB
MQSRLVQKVPAVYPLEAREKHIEGTALLEIVVGTNGSVEQIEVLSGPQVLAKAAMDAVRQWKYEPTYIKGSAVKVVTRVQVSFHLE